MDTPNIVDVAIGYAARGWPVLPLWWPTRTGSDPRCACGRRGEHSIGKHPITKNGLTEASVDPEVIRRWWDRYPVANIGVCTGHGFDVVDIDGTEGFDRLAAFDLDADPILGPVVVTGRLDEDGAPVGAHTYVEATGRGNVRGSLPEKVEHQGRGGYVVAPPSLHPSGRRYRFDEVYNLDYPIRSAPAWYLALLERPKTRQNGAGAPGDAAGGVGGTRYGLKALESELGRLATAREGDRNHALNRAAFALGQLIAGGELNEHHVWTELCTVAGRIGLADGEITSTVKSGFKSGLAAPRSGRTKR